MLIVLCFSFHLVSLSLEILGINLLLKTDFQTECYIFGSSYGVSYFRHSIDYKIWLALVFFIIQDCLDTTILSNPRPSHFSDSRLSFFKKSLLVIYAIVFESGLFSLTNSTNCSLSSLISLWKYRTPIDICSIPEMSAIWCNTICNCFLKCRSWEHPHTCW